MKPFWNVLMNRIYRENIYNLAEFWDTKAESFADKAVSMWPNSHLNELYHQEQLKVPHDDLPDMRNKQILDVGCGMGRMSRYFAEHSIK